MSRRTVLAVAAVAALATAAGTGARLWQVRREDADDATDPSAAANVWSLSFARLNGSTLAHNTGISAVSHLLFIPVQQGEVTANILCHTSLVVVRKRLIWIAYYRLYKGSDTVAACKAGGQELVRMLDLKQGFGG